MYNLLKALTLLLLLGVTGCLRDELGKCPQVNLIFRYDADSTVNVLEKYIQGAVLYIFDRNGNIITEQQLSSGELQDKKGIRLILPEDTYHLVCWGNVGDYSRIILNDRLQNCQLHSAYIDYAEKFHSCDPLYYASCDIEALSGKENPVEVKFHSAHIRMEVYVYGFEKKYGVDIVPKIRMTGLDTQYDFDMKGFSSNHAVVHFPETRWDGTEQFYSSCANVLRFTEEDPVGVCIHTPQDDLEVFRLQLNELFRQYFITRAGNSSFSLDREEAVVPVVIDFSGPEINVSIVPPYWEEKPVAPGI